MTLKEGKEQFQRVSPGCLIDTANVSTLALFLALYRNKKALYSVFVRYEKCKELITWSSSHTDQKEDSFIDVYLTFTYRRHQ